MFSPEIESLGSRKFGHDRAPRLWNFIDKLASLLIFYQGDLGRLPLGDPTSTLSKTKTMNGYYELKKTAAGKFHFTLKAGNHEVILSSQLYTAKSSALDGIAAVRTHGPHEARYERKVSVKGEPYFSLKAPNGQIIGTSEMYDAEAYRDKGVNSVIANSPSQIVKDITEN